MMHVPPPHEKINVEIREEIPPVTDDLPINPQRFSKGIRITLYAVAGFLVVLLTGFLIYTLLVSLN